MLASLTLPFGACIQMNRREIAVTHGQDSMKTEAGTIFGAAGGVALGLLVEVVTHPGWIAPVAIILTSVAVGRIVGVKLDRVVGCFDSPPMVTDTGKR